MYLPVNAGPDSPSLSQNGPALNFFNFGHDGPRAGGWSSLIGIVTSIVGNVLIAFALNTQRYAHIRLAREREQQEDGEDKDRGWKTLNRYQRQQADLAEDRAHKNLDTPHGYGQDDQDGSEATESDALLPSHAPGRSSSNDSDSTVRPTKRSDAAKSYLRSPYWWLGISLMTVGEAGNFLAYGFAPASIVSPLGVVALVVNCLIAPWMLRETFRKRDALGVIIAIAGCVTIVLSASTSNPKLAPDKIWALITTWEFETYLGITIFLILVLMMTSNTEFGERSILVDLGLVGLFGGYTALSTKGVSSLLSNTLWHAITFPITYLLVAILVFTAIMQIKYINRALQRFDSTQVIPTQFVLFTISVILGSAVLYRDFERQTTQDAVKFVAGCALTFFGVWLITSGRKADKDDDDDEEEEDGPREQDAINLVDETGQQQEIRERQDGSARIQNVKSNTPSVVITSNDAESYSATFGGTSYNDNNPYSGPIPTNISAIHASSAEQLPALPAKDGKKQQPPRMHATTSAPILPTASTLQSNNLNRPVTPIRQCSTPFPALDSHHHRTPRSPPQRPLPDVETTPGRRSIVDMLPGPLVTPLSSSLSAIVADSLRKGVDIRPRTMERRRTSRRSIRQQRSFAMGDEYPRPGTSAADGFPLRMTISEATGGDGPSSSAGIGAAGSRQGDARTGRGRSLSDFFKTRRGWVSGAGLGSGSGATNTSTSTNMNMNTSTTTTTTTTVEGENVEEEEEEEEEE